MTTTDRNLEVMRADLGRISQLVDRIRAGLADLHSLAFDRAVSGAEVTSGSRRPVYLDEVGNARAKHVWRVLERRHMPAAERLLASTAAALRALRVAGERGDGA